MPSSFISLSFFVARFCLPFFAVCLAHAQNDPAARRLLLDAALSGDAIVAVGERGTIIRSSDNGRSWKRMSSPASATLTGISFVDGGATGFAAGHGAAVLMTTDGGVSWSKVFQGPKLDQSFLDIVATDSRHVLAVGAYGFCMASSDGGKNWSPINPQDSDLHYNRIYRISSNSLWIVGEQGSVLNSADGGQHWDRRAIGYDGSLFGFLATQDDTLLCFGLRGNVFRSSSSDPSKWERIPTGASGLIATGIRLRDGTILLAGQSRLFLVSTDGGRSFKSWNPGLTTGIAELLQAPDGSILAFGEAGVSVLPSLR